jgi:hypothetical protein
MQMKSTRAVEDEKSLVWSASSMYCPEGLMAG